MGRGRKKVELLVKERKLEKPAERVWKPEKLGDGKGGGRGGEKAE